MRRVQAKPETPTTVADAAVAQGRSTTWVRDHLTMGFLERDPTSTPRRIMVTARSLRWAEASLAGQPSTRGQSVLRLVVDNSGNNEMTR